MLLEEGGEPQKALAEARAKVAALVDAAPEEIIFTGSATESEQPRREGPGPGEQEEGQQDPLLRYRALFGHAPGRFPESLGFEVDYVKVDDYGVVDLDDLKKKAVPGTVLVSIMHANLEIGHDRARPGDRTFS